LKVAPGFGLRTTDHPVPFQCSINVRELKESLLDDAPTAQTSFSATAATALRLLGWFPELGLATICQSAPNAAQADKEQTQHRTRERGFIVSFF